MRFKIKFQLSGKKQILPLNYQYPISAWIYKVLSRADKQFAQMLHESGYKTAEGKAFKLFTFSKLKFPKHTWQIIPDSDRMQIWAKYAWLNVSFQLPEQSENFVMGLFKDQKAFFGDKITGIDLQVEQVEAINDMEIGEYNNVRIKANSAILLGLDIEGKSNEQYVPPIHKDYKRVFLQNLIDKYVATGKEAIDIKSLDFKLVKLQTKSSLQTIKAFTPAETKVRAYYYEFDLSAPKEIIALGINAGFGSMNSLGFGYCEVVEI